MAGWKSQVFRSGLSGLWFSGVARATAPLLGGKGAVLMLHHVSPDTTQAFAPNALLFITPQYLRALVEGFMHEGVDIVTLDEAQRRVSDLGRTRRFVCFTFDDGYRDNLEHALPIFQRYGLPFTVYATSSFVDRSGGPWWSALEHVVRKSKRVRFQFRGSENIYDATDTAAKYRTYAAIASAFFTLTGAEARAHLARLATDHELDLVEFVTRETCDASELKQLQAGGAEIGCHSVSHSVLMCETLDSVRYELEHARTQLEQALGGPVHHLAYPYGKPDHVTGREFSVAAELGFRTATTTRKGALFSAHARHTSAWPRVEVTPNFSSSPHYLQTTLSGLPLLLWNRGRAVVTV